MAGKNDKLEGVYAIYIEEKKMVYIGKSKGVGVAERSAKSKLKYGTFHNTLLQEDSAKSGKGKTTFGVYVKEDGETLRELFDEIKSQFIEDGFLIYNDTTFIDKEVIIETNPFEDLSPYQQGIVWSVVKSLKEGCSVEVLSGKLRECGIDV
tara:strand:+ start:180 stop:632 length:453 start_codon:yes stop_codon:yes gene_type:complete